jgi:regulator of replication initiation timing
MAEPTPSAAPAAEAEKLVRIFHTGRGHGPMHTAKGVLTAGAWLDVPEALAEKLTRVYKHVRLAKDVIPGGLPDPKLVAENEALKLEIAKLGEQLKDKPSDERVSALEAAAKDFLGAESKKDLDALKEKHAALVSA